MPSSVSEGVRPSAARMRSYSSAVMLCWASICGVIVTGSGTTAAEELVIVDAFILAQGTCGAAAVFGRATTEKSRGVGCCGLRQRARRIWRISQRLCDTFEAAPPEAGMAELADAADSKSAGPCGHGGSTPPPGTIY